MTLPFAVGLGIVVVAALAVGVMLFGHRPPEAASPMAATPGAPSGDVRITVARRLTSTALLIGLTLGLAGLLAAGVGAVVFLAGLSLGS